MSDGLAASSRLAREAARLSVRAQSWARERAAGRGIGRSGELPGVVDAAVLLALALRRTLRSVPRSFLVLVGWLAIPYGLVRLVQGYLHNYGTLPVRPRAMDARIGWWAWYDQGKTLEALLAWHRHVAQAANQWYQPLYPMLGALALHLSPTQPFVWIDLAGLLASFLLFLPLAGVLGIGRLGAVLVFLLVTLGETQIIDNWVIPWNTSPTTPLLLLGLLSAAKLAQERLSARRRFAWAASFGFAVGLIPAFRPTDLLALVPAGLAVLAMLPGVRQPAGRRLANGLALLAAAAAGFVVGFAGFVASYVPTFGWRPSPYMLMSRQTGFDLRLLPLHWVTLVVGPRPLFPGMSGLIETFWWLGPCFAGIVVVSLAMLTRSPTLGRRRAHAIVLSGMVLYWCLYLSYRDLHPLGLFHYNNFHYFMWTFPLLGLYGLWLLRFCADAARSWWRFGIARGSRPSALVAAGIVLTVLSLCWRPELGPWPHPDAPPRLDMAHDQVLIPGGLSNTRDALLLSVHDPSAGVYFGNHDLTEDGQHILPFTGFRAFPIPGGTMVVPLRELAHGDATLRFDRGVTLDPTVAPRLLRQDTRFGLPCWAPRAMRATECADDSPLPGPLFPAIQLDFDGKMEPPFLIPGGWTDQQDGRWTLGYHSTLQFRVPHRDAIGGGVVVEVEGAGFVPRGSEHLVIDVAANGLRLTQWRVSTTEEVALQVGVPAALIPSNGQIRLTISVLNARRPIDALARSVDYRLLGFRVRAIRLRPWSPEINDPGVG